MTISEFAETRGQQAQTISKWIQRHPSDFDGHIRTEGRTKILDDVAVELLDKEYPLPKPVTIIQGVPEQEHLRALADKDAEIQRLQKALIDLSEKHSQTLTEMLDIKAKALLLEDRDRQIETLEKALDTERSKTWLQKLLGK